MTRSDLVKRVGDILRQNRVRKIVSLPKQVFHISDDDGNSKDFAVRGLTKPISYTAADIDAIIGACLCAIKDALTEGEPVSIRGIGTLYMDLRAERSTKHVGTGEWITIPAHYVPKFAFGKDLQRCARLYNAAVKEGRRAPVGALSKDYLNEEADE
nr:MAG TPA: Bacterial DNA-binding protein [Caudoviricetes sp.]